MSSGEHPSGGERVYEMLWDCRFCDTRKLLGLTHRFCPNCGGAQDSSWRYFPSDAEKVAVQDHVYVGADKICPACDGLNAGGAHFCGACGAPLDRAAEAAQQRSRTRAQDDQFETEDLAARRQQEMLAAARGISGQAAPAQKKRSRGCLYAVLGVAALAVVGILLAIFWTQEVTATVADYRWEREIHIEALLPRSGSGDCGGLPADAYSVDRRYEQVGSRSVPDGETCRTVQTDRGDGTFSERQVCETRYRQEPVYGYVCYYTVDRWGYARTASSGGGRDTAPYWPELSLRRGECRGCEREARRGELYLLVFERDDGERFECPVSAAEWQSTPLRTAFKLQVGVLGGERCDTLQRR